MNKIAFRLIYAQNNLEDIFMNIIKRLTPQLVKIINKSILTNKHLQEVKNTLQNNDKIFNTLSNEIDDIIYESFQNIKLKRNEIKVLEQNNIISNKDLEQQIYYPLTQAVKDEVYPAIFAFLYTITDANTLFKSLKDANILDKFILKLIKNSPTINFNLRKILLKNSTVKINSLKTLIDLKILDASIENCTVINKGLVKIYQHELQQVMNTWNDIILNISVNELKKFLQLIKDININVSVIQQKINEVQEALKDNSISSSAELLLCNIKTGESVKISKVFHDNTHYLDATPLLYFNGNFISDVKSSIKLNADTQRIYHKTLLDGYLGNESLHKNDIIKKPMSEWRYMKDHSINSLEYIVSGEYEAASIIIYPHVIIFYSLPQYINLVVNLLQSYNKPIFYLQDNAISLTKVASRLKYKCMDYFS